MNVPSKGENKYIKISALTYKKDYEAIKEDVAKGKIKWAFYCLDNDKGYHYYLKIK